ncbi:uncharacterized protein FN964_013102 isoform 3-T4 [Alca torda]
MGLDPHLWGREDPGGQGRDPGGGPGIWGEPHLWGRGDPNIQGDPHLWGRGDPGVWGGNPGVQEDPHLWGRTHIYGAEGTQASGGTPIYGTETPPPSSPTARETLPSPSRNSPKTGLWGVFGCFLPRAPPCPPAERAAVGREGHGGAAPAPALRRPRACPPPPLPPAPRGRRGHSQQHRGQRHRGRGQGQRQLGGHLDPAPGHPRPGGQLHLRLRAGGGPRPLGGLLGQPPLEVVVKEAAPPLRLEAVPPGGVVGAGQPLALTCRAPRGHFPLRFRFYRDGAQLRQWEPQTDGISAQIHIPHVPPAFGGRFSCRVEEDAGGTWVLSPPSPALQVTVEGRSGELPPNPAQNYPKSGKMGGEKGWEPPAVVHHLLVATRRTQR